MTPIQALRANLSSKGLTFQLRQSKCRNGGDGECGRKEHEKESSAGRRDQWRHNKRCHDGGDAAKTRRGARPAPAQRGGVELGTNGIQGTPGTEVEEGQQAPGDDDEYLGACGSIEPGGYGGADQEYGEGNPPAPDLNEPGGGGIARQLCQGNDEGEAEGFYEREAIGNQQGRDPDEGAVIGEIDAKPNGPQRRRAAAQARPPNGGLGGGGGFRVGIVKRLARGGPWIRGSAPIPVSPGARRSNRRRG